MSLRRSLEAFCAQRWVGVSAPLWSVLLCLPALGVGYQVDDWIQQAILRGVEPDGPSPPRPPLTEFFAFVDGDPERHRALLDLGVLPWWAWPDLEVRFFRPLSALTHWVDHQLAPGSAAFAHLHSLLWLGALVALAGALYRRIHGPTAVAGLAALLYAVDEAHGIPVGWIANRNALICGTFGFSVLLLYDRGRRDGSLPARTLGPLLLLSALAAGEAAIAVLSWLVAYAVCLDGGSVRARAARLVPFFAVTVGWRLLYRGLGYGTHGSGVYIDPLTSPIDFLGQLPARTVLLLSDQLLSAPSIAVDFLAEPTRTLALVCVIPPLVLVVGLGALALRDMPEARFWALGALLSIPPVASTAPAARLLTFVGLGGAALVAMLVERVLWRDARGPRWLAWALLAVHAGLAAVLLPAQAWEARILGARLVDPCEQTLPDGPGVRETTVVFVNSNDLCAANLLYRRNVDGRPRPAAVRLLASALYDVDVRRLDAHTLQIDVPTGMQSTPADRLHRLDVAMPVGQIVAVPGMTVEITSWNDDDRVDQFRVRFDRPLDDPSLLWMGSVDLRSVPLTLPEEGGVLHLPGAF